MKLALSSLILLWASVTVAIAPSQRYISTPAELGLKYDSVRLVTSDGYHLTAWYCMPPQESNRVVVLAGGDAGNMSYNLPVASLLVSTLGVNVLMFDYRGFGSSGSFRTDTNLLVHSEYLDDIKTAVAWCKSRSLQVVIYGRSMGAALAIAQGTLDSSITAVIAESPYLNQAVLAQRATERHKQRGIQRAIHFESNALLEPGQMARRLKVPVAVIVGAEDSFASTEESWTLFTQFPNEMRRSFLLLAGAGHLQAVEKGPHAVAGIVASLLEN